MASGIVIHIKNGIENRTEVFSSERVRIGADEEIDLPLALAEDVSVNQNQPVWLELVRENNSYRVFDYDEAFRFNLNKMPIVPYAKLRDGDIITSKEAKLSFQFFTLSAKSAMVATTAGDGKTVPFIEHAAIESAASPRRDDAKIFLREFLRELVKEISWLTKLVTLGVVLLALGGLFYLGLSVSQELKKSREVSEQQSLVIQKLEEQLSKTSTEISKIDKANQDIIKTVSLAPTLRNEYGNGICLIVGTYDLVDRRNGKTLRYPDPNLIASTPYEPDFNQPTVSESPDETSPVANSAQFTTDGNGLALEFDFVGTGFHVGSGYIVTNRHVVQPWAEDERTKSLAKIAGGRARLKKLVVYFPNFPNSIPIKIRQTSSREDIAVGMLDANSVFPEIPTLPLDGDSDALAVGKSVVTMGYPNGPDRILAMVDESEARSIQTKYGSSLQTLINFLAQSKKISPLTTGGAITDLDAKRIVHDAKTAEGGSGAPLFGQSAKVIGVNFGVFTESNAANMAVPIRYAIDLLKKAGWKSREDLEQEKQKKENESSNTAVSPATTASAANK